MSTQMEYRTFFILALLLIAVPVKGVDGHKGEGEGGRKEKIVEEVKAALNAVSAGINKAAKAADRTAAIKTLIAPLYTDDVVWTITSGNDPKLPTLEFTGTNNPTFIKGFLVIVGKAATGVVRFEPVSIKILSSDIAVHYSRVYSGGALIEWYSGYLVRQNGVWKIGQVTVAPYRHPCKT